MDSYALHLVGLVYDHIGPNREITVRKPGDVGGAAAHVWGPERRHAIGRGDTLAEALAALLDDLGVEYPEVPTEREVNAVFCLDCQRRDEQIRRPS